MNEGNQIRKWHEINYVISNEVKKNLLVELWNTFQSLWIELKIYNGNWKSKSLDFKKH